MSYFSTNLKVIKQEQMDLYKEFIKYKLPDHQDIHISCVRAKDNTDIIQLKTKTGQYMLNSTYEPMREAKTWAEQYNQIDDQTIVCIFGFGDGVIAQEVVKHGEKVLYLFLEPRAELFYYAMEHYDLTEFFNDPKTLLVVSGINDNTFEDILSEKLIWHNLSLFKENCLPKYDVIFPEEYKETLLRVQNMINNVAANESTAIRFANTRVINQIYNSDVVIKSSSLASCIDIFPPNMAAIIVSAGPSLLKNRHLLRQAKNKFFIIAVDTALRFLLEEDIVPDAWISVDGLKPLTMFEDPRIPNIPAFFDVESRYEVVQRAKAKRIFFDSIYEYYAELFAKCNYKLSLNISGGSVATSAYGILLTMGFSRIVLVGQDLALTGNYAYADNKLLDMNTVAYKMMVKGYYGETVCTKIDYYHYLKWFEQAILYYKEVVVINATEGGADIKGSFKMSLKDVIDSYGVAEINIHDILSSVPNALSEEKQSILKKELANMKKNIQDIKMLADKGHAICKEILLLEEHTFQEEKLKPGILRLKKIESKLNEYNEYCLVRQYTAKTESATTAHLYEKVKDAKQECKIMIDKLQLLYEAAIKACDDLIDIIDRKKDIINK